MKTWDIVKHPAVIDYNLTERMLENIIIVNEMPLMKFKGHMKNQGRALVSRGLTEWDAVEHGELILTDKGKTLVDIILKNKLDNRDERRKYNPPQR